MQFNHLPLIYEHCLIKATSPNPPNTNYDTLEHDNRIHFIIYWPSIEIFRVSWRKIQHQAGYGQILIICDHPSDGLNLYFSFNFYTTECSTRNVSAGIMEDNQPGTASRWRSSMLKGGQVTLEDNLENSQILPFQVVIDFI